MKRIVVLTLILALVGGIAFGQIRLDAGIAIPIGIATALDGSSLQMNSVVGELFASTLLPLFEVAFHYQFDLGMVKLGLGARAFSYICETLLWPNAFVEYDFGLIIAEAQIGGGGYLLLGQVSAFQAGKVFFPDLSVWMRLGREQVIRVGMGIIGIYLPEQRSSFPIVIYLGGKIAMTPD
jgi:hypothetical protein